VADKKELLLIEIREDGARVVKKNITDLGAAGDATTNQMNKLKAVLGGLVSAKVIKDTIMLADAYANMLNRLRVVTSGQYELRAAMESVFKMSRETRTSLEANVDMYARIAINTRQMGMGMEKVTKFAKQLNHAIILSGVTAREAQWGMVQFSQALASNALRGDELRATLEQLPVVTDVISEHFGVTRGELRELGFQGRITAKEIIAAFNEAEESLAERFAKRIPTVDQGITVLRSSIVRFVGEMDQGYQITSNFARALLYVADHMDQFGRFAAIAGVILGTVYLKNLISIVAQMKLFNLSLLKANMLKSILAVGAVAMVVYADKIKIASDSSATLADTFKALGERAKITYALLREGISNLISGSDIHADFKVTFESILTDLSAFTDHFLGVFVGIGQVIKKIFGDIPGYAKLAWNGIISGLEKILDTIVAVFKTAGDMFKIFGLNVKSGMIALAASMEQVLAGNIAVAKQFADQAALSFENAAGFKNFGALLRQNLEDAASEDSLAGAKFKIKAAGETLGQAFMRGFGMSNLIETGVTELFERAKGIAASRESGVITAPVEQWSPTPIQSQLIKEMTGNAGELVNKMEQLRDMWDVVSQRAQDKQLFDFDMYSRKMTELRIKSLETATGVVDGFKRGFMQMTLEMSNFANQAEKTIVNAFSRAEDALVNFVKTGKVDFKSLVDSMLGDLTRLLARQALMGLFNQFAGAGGILGSFASGPTAAAAPTTVSSVVNSLIGGGKQLGGHVSPGTSYLVGEKRPEIFTPAQPGHVTPSAAVVPQAPPNVVVINVASEEEAKAAAASYLNSSEGDRLIQNTIRTAQDGSY